MMEPVNSSETLETIYNSTYHHTLQKWNISHSESVDCSLITLLRCQKQTDS